jgi:DNA-3-methyladenine glycosylase II
MISIYHEADLSSRCIQLATTEPVFKLILDSYNLPPYWGRENCFETLVLTILEQQVSLASANAAYRKLKEELSDITAEGILLMSDERLRGCYLSRQKTTYVKALAIAVSDGIIDFSQLEKIEDAEVRHQLKKIKGIGDWTVDIFLLHALKRTDVFPTGDLALVNAIRMIREDELMTKEAMYNWAEDWRPYRSMATMMFWHYYIKKKNIRMPVTL